MADFRRRMDRAYRHRGGTRITRRASQGDVPLPQDTPKIAIVGAGGWVFPLEISRDILAHPGLSGSTIALYDIVPSAAERTLEHVRA